MIWCSPLTLKTQKRRQEKGDWFAQRHRLSSRQSWGLSSGTCHPLLGSFPRCCPLSPLSSSYSHCPLGSAGHTQHFTLVLPGPENSLSSLAPWADSRGKGIGLVSLLLAVWSFPYSIHPESQHKSSLMLALKILGHFKIQTQIWCSQNCFPACIIHIDPDSL